jgi:hypothetical protein
MVRKNNNINSSVGDNIESRIHGQVWERQRGRTLALVKEKIR